jgi:translation initiation factor 6
MIKKLSLFDSDFVGLFIRAWDDLAIVPSNVDDSVLSEIQDVLQANVQKSSMDPSGMFGIFSVMNSTGVIISGIYGKKDVDFETGQRNVLFLKDNINAVGNDIIANDHGAMVHEEFTKKSIKQIEDVLGVETVQGSIGGFPTVGSSSVLTTKGMIVNPETSDEQIEILKDFFKVPVKLGTANFGSPMVGSSIIANKAGIIVGKSTTSIEITVIDDVLS